MMDVTFPVFESLDEEKILAAIKPAPHVENLFRIDVFDLISSTNTYLLECAKQKNVSGWFCFAEQQSKGRGRLGRSWYSPRGASIYCSVLWCLPAAEKDWSALSLVIGVIVIEVLNRYGVTMEVGLKWPNDLIVAGRKLGGVLLECLPEQNAKIPVVIGIGINLELPKPSEERWIDVAEISDRPIRRNEMAGLLVDELLAQLPVYEREGLGGFIDRWRQRDILRGQVVRIQKSEEEITGTVLGINDGGEIILKTVQGEIQLFCCGEVVLESGIKSPTESGIKSPRQLSFPRRRESIASKPPAGGN